VSAGRESSDLSLGEIVSSGFLTQVDSSSSTRILGTPLSTRAKLLVLTTSAVDYMHVCCPRLRDEYQNGVENTGIVRPACQRGKTKARLPNPCFQRIAIGRERCVNYFLKPKINIDLSNFTSNLVLGATHPTPVEPIHLLQSRPPTPSPDKLSTHPLSLLIPSRQKTAPCPRIPLTVSVCIDVFDGPL